MSLDKIPTPLNWTQLDEDWKARWDPPQFAAYERELDSALFGRGGEVGYPLLWRWARLSHFRAMQVLLSPADEKKAREEAVRHFEEGARQAEAAIPLQPNRVEGFFWAGVCAVEAARLQGPLVAARALKPAQKRIEKAAAVDEEYHFAGPLRVLGRLTHLKPLILGGSLDRALEIFRRAVQIAPGNSTTLLYYAQALIADRQPALAKKVLAQIIDAPEDPDWKWEQARDKKLAREELAKI
jgi:tetratricopeptide (TPR) repeat protein